LAEIFGDKASHFPPGCCLLVERKRMDDWQLLEHYAHEHAEEAFRTLVERYAGMVYHAALRQTGNPHTAEEVAQLALLF
jgi:hypothetical protein